MTKIEIPNTSYLNSIWILFLIFRLIKQCQNTNNKSNIQTSKKKKTTDLYNFDTSLTRNKTCGHHQAE